MSRKPSMMSNGRTPWKDPTGSLICKDPDLSLGNQWQSPYYIFACRTTKLLSQKRRHLAVFCISFLWQKGTRLEKRRDYYLKKKPSSGILHQSNCSRIRPNNENSKFKREFITILIPLWQAAVQACGGWHVCLGTFLLWPKLLCQLWAPFSPILCALWGESKSLECLFQQSQENIPNQHYT